MGGLVEDWVSEVCHPCLFPPALLACVGSGIGGQLQAAWAVGIWARGKLLWVLCLVLHSMIGKGPELVDGKLPGRGGWKNGGGESQGSLNHRVDSSETCCYVSSTGCAVQAVTAFQSPCGPWTTAGARTSCGNSRSASCFFGGWSTGTVYSFRGEEHAFEGYRASSFLFLNRLFPAAPQELPSDLPPCFLCRKRPAVCHQMAGDSKGFFQLLNGLVL